MALRDLGFTALQETVYRALLIEPQANMETLGARTGAVTDDIAEALSGLIDLAVVLADATAPAGVVLVSPMVAIGQLIERVEDELLTRQRSVSSTRAELTELVTLFSRDDASPDPDGAIEQVESVEMVRKRLEELAFFTRRSAYSVQPGGPQSAASLAASRPLDHRALRRGVDMRIVYNVSALDDEANRSYVRELTTLGAKVRVTEAPLQRLIIMDERVGVVPIDPHNSRRGALVVQQAGLLAGFLELFHRTWEDAMELPWVNDPLEDEPAEEDRQVLRLLASGKTDETAARELGVSVRHLRRRVARLMDRLQAQSRFEAGVEAVRRGWI
jgi:DNA-binding CsgD family transcriptional regulator/sugar-specific transcriptional regulator TrmB